jgi:AcrR family transcriptional regulator
MKSSDYEEISISDLCDQLQIPRKSFYRYFSSKDSALHALIDHTQMLYEMKNLHTPSGKGRSARKELESYFRFWQDQRQLLDALERSGLSGVLVQRAIEYALSEGNIRRPLAYQTMLGEQEYAIMFGICGLMTMMVQWHHDGYAVPVEQIAAVAERVLTKPLFQDP